SGEHGAPLEDVTAVWPVPEGRSSVRKLVATRFGTLRIGHLVGPASDVTTVPAGSDRIRAAAPSGTRGVRYKGGTNAAKELGSGWGAPALVRWRRQLQPDARDRGGNPHTHDTPIDAERAQH